MKGFLAVFAGLLFLDAAQAAGPAAQNANAPAVSAQSIGLEFVKIQPGTFRMGCVEGDTLCDADENPAHQVRTSNKRKEQKRFA